ncbi:unnamed protein product [Cyprideis torosa]|uniref:Uncharacterized protein n=1 Tax=Cyprideis torosa TaxID=163714 RepID=A0A7R8WG47_9CRUS|nr:unnamed protein product [Cyprideis torosa]CAG0894879.1 unnamed protein product [Cyprideis torosa]
MAETDNSANDVKAPNLVLMGLPGYGKKTQAQLLKEYFDICHLSPGGMIRRELASSSSMGQEIREVLRKGGLLSDKLLSRMLRRNLDSDECARGFLLEGFPQTVRQAKMIDRVLLDRGTPLHAVVNLTAGNKEQLLSGIVERMAPIDSKGEAAEDGLDLQHNEESVTKRIQELEETGGPLTNYYRTQDRSRESRSCIPSVGTEHGSVDMAEAAAATKNGSLDLDEDGGVAGGVDPFVELEEAFYECGPPEGRINDWSDVLYYWQRLEREEEENKKKQKCIQECENEWLPKPTKLNFKELMRESRGEKTSLQTTPTPLETLTGTQLERAQSAAE